MTRIPCVISPNVRWLRCRHAASGFSLVELMIAMVLGLLLAEGIYVLFAASSRNNATQFALSRLQENGRIAIDTLAADLRLAGRLPCGTRVQPQVFSDALAAHVTGAPAIAAAAPGSVEGQPYRLDRGLFISANTCIGTNCSPLLAAGLGVPRAGLAAGDRVPGTDVLTVRYLQGEGLPASASSESGACGAKDAIVSISAAGMSAAGFVPGHLALLASCTSVQMLAVTPAGSFVQPVAGKFGVPKCASVGAQPRLFDIDTQLLTTTYYLQVVQDEMLASHKVATLMRRVNGVVNEVVQGVERLDMHFSLTDKDGIMHWLSAIQVDAGTSAAGAPLQCVADAGTRRCSWADVDAVDIALLVNTVDDLPLEASSAAWDYRYSIDGDDMRTPKATMPVTGLQAGRMLRREFRTTVALRSLSI